MNDKNHVCERCGKPLSDINWWTFGLFNRWDEGVKMKLCDSCAEKASELVGQMRGERDMTPLVLTFTCPKDDQKRNGWKCLECEFCVHGMDNNFYCGWNIMEEL